MSIAQSVFKAVADFGSVTSEAGRAGTALRTMGKDAEGAGATITGAYSKAGSSVSGFAKLAVSAAKTIAAGLAANQLVKFAASAVDTFAYLQDATAAAGVIFGDSMDAIMEQSRTAAATLGLTQAEVIDGANTFGTYGKAAGLAGDDLSGFATQFTALAGDLASFKGRTPQEAIMAIGSALRGEVEPIRAFGVLLDDASLKARAMKMGIADGTSTLTAQQKVLAASAEILAQTTDAQGDFIRTQDSAANVAKTYTATLTEMKSLIGQKIEPLFTATKKTVTGMARAFLDANSAGEGFSVGMKNAYASLKLSFSDDGLAGKLVNNIKSGFGNAKTWITTTGVSQIASALSSGSTALFNAAMSLAPAISGGFLTVMQQLVTALPTVLDGVANALTQKAPAFLTAATEVFLGLVVALQQMIPQLSSVLVAFLPQLAAALVTGIPAIVDAAGSLFDAMILGFVTVVPLLIQMVQSLLPQIVQVITEVIPAIVDALAGAVPELLSAGIELFMTLLEAAVTALPLVVQAVVDLLPTIANALITALPLIVQAGVQLFTALAQAIPLVLPVLMEAVLTLIPAIVQTILSVLPQLLDAGIQLFMALVQALLTVLPQIILALIEFIPQFQLMILEQLPAIIAAAVELFNGLLEGFKAVLPLIIQGIIDMMPPLVAALQEQIPAMIEAAIPLFAAIAEALVQALPTITTAVGSDMLPALFDAIGQGVAGMLIKGKELFDSLWAGMQEVWENVKSWLGGLGSQILGALGDLSGILSGAGRAIIDGLLSGMRSAWDAGSGFISGLGGWIAANKGPKSYDLRLLQPAGNWIMTGLQKGLLDGMPGLTKTLDRVTSVVGGIDPSGLLGSWGGSGQLVGPSLQMPPLNVASPSGLAGGGMTIENIQVNNPIPERGSESTARAVRRAVFMAGV